MPWPLPPASFSRPRRSRIIGGSAGATRCSSSCARFRVNSLPDGADRQKIREVLGPEGEDDVFLVGLTWESLGVLAFRREVTLDVMADFFSGAIVISWRRLHLFVEEDRRDLKRETVWEWFQWLAERMIERKKKSPPNPAHIAHRDWK